MRRTTSSSTKDVSEAMAVSSRLLELPVDQFLRNGVASVPVALVPSNDGVIKMKNPKVIQSELKAATTHYHTITEMLHRAVASNMGKAIMAPAASLESIEDVARRELGETPATKQTALNELRKLIISEEPSLHCPLDDAFLVKFLRARKYDTRAAFKNVKKYFKVRTEHPEMFKDLAPSTIPFDAMCRKNRLTTVSRHRDPMGRAVALMKVSF